MDDKIDVDSYADERNSPPLFYSSPIGNCYNSASNELFIHDIQKKQTAHQKRFQSKWENIIGKYEAIAEDEQGDVIDLATGEIIEDKGHLRSLKTGPPEEDIWGEFYDFERDKKNERSRKYYWNLKDDSNNDRSDFSPSKIPHEAKSLTVYQDNLLLLEPSSSPIKAESPTIRKSQQGAMEARSHNNFLYLDYPDSPTKMRIRSRVSSPSSSDRVTKLHTSNMKKVSKHTPGLWSDRKGTLKVLSSKPERFNLFSDYDSNSYNMTGKCFSSPIKSTKSAFEQYSDDLKMSAFEYQCDSDAISATESIQSSQSNVNLYIETEISTNTKKYRANAGARSNSNSINNETNDASIISIPSESEQNSTQSMDDFSIVDFDASGNLVLCEDIEDVTEENFQEDLKSNAEELLLDAHRSDFYANSITDEFAESVASSDESEVVLESSVGKKALQKTCWICPFTDCYHKATRKATHKRHIEKSHPQKLMDYGYSVSESSYSYARPQLNEHDAAIYESLKEEFPIILEVPPLPDGDILHCPVGFCQKWFVKESFLRRHMANGNQCSSKRTRLVCPALGCKYVSYDYMKFREHFIKAQHHIHPNYRLAHHI